MAFRRRSPFRRRFLGPGRGPIRRAAIRQLKLAHQLFDDGHWSQAAEQFERLASAAEDHKLPQAPQLYLLSSRARLENGEHAIGVKQLHHAIQLFGQYGQIQRLSRLRHRLSTELKQHGLDHEAVEIEKVIHDLLDQAPSDGIHVDPPDSAGRLPVKCNFCGGAIRPDEVQWFDSSSAACAYCGSVVQAE